jgi:hypothetical protein
MFIVVGMRQPQLMVYKELEHEVALRLAEGGHRNTPSVINSVVPLQRSARAMIEINDIIAAFDIVDQQL